MSSSCPLTFFSFLLLISYHPRVFLEEVLHFPKKHNFPDPLCYLSHLPKGNSALSHQHNEEKPYNFSQAKILPVHVFQSSFLLVLNIRRDFLKAICQLPRSKQIQDLALLVDILQSRNKMYK